MDNRKTKKPETKKTVPKVSVKKQIQLLSDEINKKISERWLKKLINK